MVNKLTLDIKDVKGCPQTCYYGLPLLVTSAVASLNIHQYLKVYSAKADKKGK